MYSRSDSTSTPSAIHHDDTKSTLAQDDENNSDATIPIRSTTESPESLSSDKNVVQTTTTKTSTITSNIKSNRNRFKAKFDHAKYEKNYFFCLIFVN